MHTDMLASVAFVFKCPRCMHKHARSSLQLYTPADYAPSAARMITPSLDRSVIYLNQISLELHIKLVCNTAWVSVPEVLVLMHNGRSFNIEVKYPDGDCGTALQ